MKGLERRGLGVEIYNRGTPRVIHAGCPIAWELAPMVEFARHDHNPIRGKLTIVPRIPERTENWRSSAKCV
jgi:hypothetical protein